MELFDEQEKIASCFCFVEVPQGDSDVLVISYAVNREPGEWETEDSTLEVKKTENQESLISFG